VSPRSRDAVHAVGEVVSSRIVAAAFADHGIASSWVDARTVLITDAEHNAALANFYSIFGDVQTCDEVLASLARGKAAAQVENLGL